MELAASLILASLFGFGWAVEVYFHRTTRASRDQWRSLYSEANVELDAVLAQRDKLAAEFRRWSDRDEKGRFVKREG